MSATTVPNTIVTTAAQVESLVQIALPTITLWNRVEGRTRTESFDRALRAEVRDALWMLTRQWQLGEFKGDDAASPIEAKVRLARTLISKYRPDSFGVEPFDDKMPLETKVERRPIAFTSDGRDMALDLRLLAGRHWLKLIAADPAVRSQYIAKYPIHQPDPSSDADAIYCAHPQTWSSFAAAAGRAMDGVKLYEHLQTAGAHAWDGIAGLDQAAIDLAAGTFVKWFDKLIDRPPAEDAWLPKRLEYQFAVSAPDVTNEKVYVAEEYFHGHLDWYNVERDTKQKTLGAPDGKTPEQSRNRTMIPTPVTFSGMPNTRWWTFEEGLTSFGDINPQTAEPSKLLLMEFGLTFANDWFLIPYTTPSGSIVKVRGIAVTDVFGDRTWIEAAGSGKDDDWERWAMFLVNTKGKSESEAADISLVLLPSAPDVQEGRPLEEVMLVRDEIANMVWGVEKTIPMPSGTGANGTSAGREFHAWFERKADAIVPPPAPPPVAAIRYDAMRGVPENWIPFVPVHVPGSSRKTQLQRGAMLRIIEKLPETKVRPRTSLLRVGLPSNPYFVHEEEVPRAGVVVTQRYQRTRWRDGRAWVWLGVRKQTGRGEATSTLAFDRIVPVPDKK